MRYVYVLGCAWRYMQDETFSGNASGGEILSEKGRRSFSVTELTTQTCIVSK